MSLHWYVLRHKPHKGEALFSQVASEGLECYYPRLKVNPINPRARKTRPYFPGYMFVQANLNELGIDYFEWKLFSLGLVKYGDQPAIVPENLVKDLRQHIEQFNQYKEKNIDGLDHGTKVQIVDGPFTGYEAIFDVRLSGKARIRVLLQLLNDRKLPLELDFQQIIVK